MPASLPSARWHAVAAEGYDQLYGARPLKRVIQTRLQNPPASELLRHQYRAGDRVKIHFQNDAFVFARCDESRAVVETEAVA